MRTYKELFTSRSFLTSLFIGLFLLAGSLIFQFYASAYATSASSNTVTDIILSNTRVYDVDGVFIYGSIFATLVVLSICAIRPKYLPFITKSVALFTIIRAVFITLTHISPYPIHSAIDSVFFREALFGGIFTGNDLFFSGHTGVPFLLALMFWDNKFLRYLFIFFSLSFATIVLLGHIHYSIDVFSAFFITYTIFHIAMWMFPKDYELFKHGSIGAPSIK